jgi:hypothetical protein
MAHGASGHAIRADRRLQTTILYRIHHWVNTIVR